jgi:hypothetical protein
MPTLQGSLIHKSSADIDINLEDQHYSKIYHAVLIATICSHFSVATFTRLVEGQLEDVLACHSTECPGCYLDHIIWADGFGNEGGVIQCCCHW